MSFTLGPLRFIDSYQFMAESLDVLSRDLADNEMPATKALVEEFMIPVSDEFADQAKREALFKLLRKKGIYPYEYVDSHARFEEDKLPPHNMFYSHLSRSATLGK